jgi:HSP20 family protein
MTLVKYNPFKPYKTLPINTMIDDFFGSSLSDFLGTEFTSSTPSVNIVENNDDYKIEVAAPGLGKEDFNIEVDNNNLIISATKESNIEDNQEGKYTRREFNYSSFKRSFHLSEEINRDAINASYENGVLTITLGKKDEAIKKAPKTVEIK